MLERQEVRDGSNPCIYRLAQEGLPFILPHISKQRLSLSLEEFKSLLVDRALRIPMTVPYVTVRPPKPQAEESKGGEEAGQSKGGEAKGSKEGGLGAAANGAASKVIERPETCEQLSSVFAGCCVVTIR
jgi:hypothetical protein